MSRSDRGKETAALEWALPLIGIVIALLLAGGLGWLDGREAERRYQSPHRHAESAKASAQRACAGLEPAAVFECVYQKVEASENTAQTEQDLSAQQRAATSALASAIVALFTLVATIVGVWFVRRTLDATLEAVRDTSEATEAMRYANEIARSGQRAWMTDADPNISEMVNDTVAGWHYRDAIGFNHTWENTGSTPAIEARCLTTISIVAWDAQPSPHIFPEPTDKTRTIGPGKKASGTVRVLSDRLTQSFRAQQCKVFVYSRIEYFDIFDRKTLRVSEACHEAFVPGGSINDEPQPSVAFRIVGSQNTLT